MRRNLFVVVGALALAVAAVMLFTGFGLAQANPPADDGPYPRVDVSTTIEKADAISASGTIKVCNTSKDPIAVTIESIDDNLYYMQDPGSWEELAKATVDDIAPGILEAGDCFKDGTWLASYDDLPDGTINIRNEVGVVLEERDMVFYGRDCYDFR